MKRMFGDYSGSFKIPLNPPLSKGDLNSPLRKRGVGGDFPASGCPEAGEYNLKMYLNLNIFG
jgi:hypothetical protein